MISEADEASTSRERALENLRDQVAKGETHGVIAMYERAAWNAGATVRETEAVQRAVRARLVDNRARR